MNTDKTQDIIRVFGESGLHKVGLEVDDMKIKMKKGATADSRAVHTEPVITEPLPPVTATPQTAPFPAMEVKRAAGTWVKAPLVSTYYNARSQGGTSSMEIGQQVKKGDVLHIVEAVKVMNEILSPVDGIVQEILITNETIVEFDQELIRIGEATWSADLSLRTVEESRLESPILARK